MAQNCYVRRVRGPQQRFNLPNGETIHLGRTIDTNITDTAVSRKQIALRADYTNYIVEVVTQGANYSGCNGYLLKKGCTYRLEHGDCLQLRLGVYEYEIMFEPAPKEEQPSGSKRRRTDKAPTPLGGSSHSLGLWEFLDNNRLIIFTSPGVKPQMKIAGFDLDGTLIKTRSGNVFPKHVDDWQLNIPSTRNKLQSLIADNYKVVIFTNQAGVGRDQALIGDLKVKIEAILEELKLPIQVFVSPLHGRYRKPALGMWETLEMYKNNGVDIDKTQSFYVGDAAGRPKNWAWKKNKDHSICDRLFALNLGLRFYTPEEYFLGARAATFDMPVFDPKTAIINQPVAPPIIPQTQEVVMMVGIMGSGKTYYFEKYFRPAGYIHVNRDKLASWQACVRALEIFLPQKKSVVIDNTNPDRSTRARYLEIAKRHNIPVRCIWMTTSIEQAKHNNFYREIIDEDHIVVPTRVFNMYRHTFQEPMIEEGFDEICKVDFIPTFTDPEKERLYRLYLVD